MIEAMQEEIGFTLVLAEKTIEKCSMHMRQTCYECRVLPL